MFLIYLYYLFLTVQKYRFNRLLTKDPSEINSLEFKLKQIVQ